MPQLNYLHKLALAIAITTIIAVAPIARAQDLSPTARAQLAARSERAIQRGIEFLIADQMPDGSWSEQNPDADNYAVGRTALVTLALLSAGESHQSDPLLHAIAFLTKAQPRTTYAVALRAAAFSQLPEPARPKQLRADLNWLLGAVISDGEGAGMYTYGPGGQHRSGDFSNSQYGALGAWYAADTGLEVPFSYWRKVESAWTRGQNHDGGWGYLMGTDQQSYASMTAAGVATLYITHDFLHTRDTDLSHNHADHPLDRGIQWLGDNFAVDHNSGLDPPPTDGQDQQDQPPPRPAPGARRFFRRHIDSGTYINYMLFGYERVGEATGLTHFGTHRWFDEGADYLCRTQDADGSWTNSCGTEADTAYSLLFLARGLSPVVIQKLSFGTRWDNRPRDVAALVRFVRHATERHVNWQVLDSTAPPADWRESPIVYLASDQAHDFTDDEKRAMLTYVDEGGLLLCANEGDTSDFTQSIETLAAQLFPTYPLHDLPHDHPAFTLNYPADDSMPTIKGVNNGIRDLLILIPSGDLPKRWQVDGGASANKHSSYAIPANLLLYATDSANPERKDTDHWIDRDDSIAPAQQKLQLICLKYDGNWDPEPAAWPRLANLLHNQRDLELTITPASIPGPPPPWAGEPPTPWIAVITATTNLTSAQLQGLDHWLNAGGLLFFDAAGGSPEAAASFRTQIARLIPNAKFTPLPDDHPIYTGHFANGKPIGPMTYRRSAQPRTGHTTQPRLTGIFKDNRLIAIESDEDLTAALANITSANIPGYTPQSATTLMRNLLLWYATTTNQSPHH